MFGVNSIGDKIKRIFGRYARMLAGRFSPTPASYPGGRDPADGHGDQIYAEQVRALYRHAPLAFVVTLLNALILTVVLWHVVPHRGLLIWAGCIAGTVLLRAFLVSAYRRRSPPPQELRSWCRWFVIGALLSGVGWGAPVVVLYPLSSVPHQLFIAFVLAGMSAGATVTLSARKTALLAFQLPTLLPLTLRMLAHGDQLHLAMGIMSATFALTLVVVAMGWHGMIVRSLATRFENSELMQSMAAANRELSLLLRGLDRHSDVVMTDHEGRITYVNDRFCERSQYHRRELIGRAHGLIGPDPRERESRRNLWATISAGRVWKGEVPDRKRDGTPYWVDCTIVPERGTDGRPARYVEFRTDITERKHAELALEASNTRLKAALGKARELTRAAESASQAKSEFLANMSHEIRTPMNGVLGMLELLRDTAPDREQRKYAALAHKSGQGLLVLLDDILDLSKIEAGRLELEELEFDPVGVMDDVVRLMQGRARNKGLRLTCLPSDVPARVLGDPTRLRQVLTNLVSNAVKFTATGEVSLRVAALAGDGRLGLSFEVRDTGIGIAAEQQARIFEAFTQADGSTTRAYGGTGLGLAICTNLVEAMGGEMGVESEPGQGSVFRFTVRMRAVADGASPMSRQNGDMPGEAAE